MKTDGHYQLEGNAPELYERYLVPAVTSRWAADLLARAHLRPGETVLDLACGTGIVARQAAKRMGSGRVIGADVNAGMLRVARAVAADARIAWLEASALNLPFSQDSFDLVLCQLGLQFFPGQGLALVEMHRVLSPAGRLALSVFTRIEHTPGANAFVLALDRVLGPHASWMKRGEHLFEHPDQLRTLLRNAGFLSVEVTTVCQEISFPSVLDYVRFQLMATPMARLLADRSDRELIISELAMETKRLSTALILQDGSFSFPQEAFVATGRKSG